MIEWILGLVIGGGLVMVVYAGAFLLTMQASRSEGFKKRLSSRPWMSNVVVGPVVLMGSLLIIIILSNGDYAAWGLQFPDFGGILAVAFSGSVLAACIAIAAEAAAPTPNQMKPPSDRWGRVQFLILIVVLASISEEFLFRGVLQNAIDTSLLIAVDFGFFSLTSGAIISGLVFAFIHAAPAKRFGTSPKALVGSALILGIAAGVALHETSSLLAPVLVHALFNLFGFVMSLNNSQNS